MIQSRRSNENRLRLYKHLKKKGLKPYICSRLRDWTINHINQYLINEGLTKIRKKYEPVYKKG